MIAIYTDGSSSQKRCGWGFVIVRDNEIIYREGGLGTLGSTNQQMELIAAIKACNWMLDHINDFIQNIDLQNWCQEIIYIYSDSAYLINCYKEKWYELWINNGWLNSRGQDVSNKDLWEQLLPFFEHPVFTFEKVKGHSGNPFNELADKIATGSVKENTKLINTKENDIINMRLSEILIEYSMKKSSIDETIKKIRKACNCE